MVENEKISGLVDGEMDEAQEATIYSEIKSSADAKEVWRTYHVIGDVMRGEGRSGIAQKRFSKALAAEPTVIAPRLRISKKPMGYSWMKIAASVAVMGLVGWVGVSDNSPIDVQVAKRNFMAEQQQVALEEAYDEAISEYLAAHQQVNPRGLGSSALTSNVDD